VNARARAQFGRKLWPNASGLPGGAAHGVPYAALWHLIYLNLAVWWIALPLAILAGGFPVRLFMFIIHHCDSTVK
jgi:fatty acid desaturase